MRWDFEDDNVPVPGGEMTEGAWAMVLGRLKAGVAL